MKQKLFTAILLLLTTIVGYGQNYKLSEATTPQGKTIVFQFIAEDDAFYSFRGNGAKLTELVATIDHYKSVITSGQATINVIGYCSSYATAKENLHSASIRANRVKSELIGRNGITEDHFASSARSTTFDGHRSVVVVRLRVPKINEPAKPQPIVEQVKPEPKPEPQPEPAAEQPKPKPEPLKKQSPEPVAVHNSDCRFALRTNLLYWLAATPNIGVEYKITESIGLLVNGAWSHWSMKDGDRQYKLWMVSPEVRWYLGESKHWFVGAEFHVGEANLKLNDTGRQGNMMGGGITGGYSLPLNDAFHLDFSLGLGYTKFDYDTYTQSNSVYVKKAIGLSKNQLMPTQAGVSLVWKICR